MLDSGLHSRCHTSEAVTKGNCTALVHTTCRQHDSYFVPTLRLWSTPWGLKVVIRGHSLIKEMMVDGVLRGLKEQAEHQTEDSDCYSWIAASMSCRLRQQELLGSVLPGTLSDVHAWERCDIHSQGAP